MADRAERLLERAQRDEATLRVHQIVVAETVWVLQSYYRRSRSEIAGALVPLLSEHGLAVENPEVTLRALEVMAQKNVDFADALLAENAKNRGEGIVSFDRDFSKLDVNFTEPG